MILFYQLFLKCYKAGIRLASLWNPKANMWIEGRKNGFDKLKKTLPENRKGKIIWMHCASLGEFEQGRPVIQQIKKDQPDCIIVISFFSPSGYEIVKNNKEIDYIYYLPMDSFFNAKKWILLLKPDLVLWVKYEYWHYYLKELKRKQIPLYLISGIFRNNQIFFKWYGGFYRNMLSCFTHFFVQNESSQQELNKIIPQQLITVSGDTRCDRVIHIAEHFTEVEGIAAFCNGHRVIVLGSSWLEDEAIWIHFVKQHPEIKFLIAPHEIDKENLNEVQQKFSGIFYSHWLKKLLDPIHKTEAISNCLVIDNIGMLSRLYYYATITYVGGGFGKNGLHNILEAAVYGKPVIFGPEYDKNFEAFELIDCGGGVSVESAMDLEKEVNRLLENEKELSQKSNASKNYVYKNAGATHKIMKQIF